MTDPAMISGEVGAIISAVIAALWGTDKVIQHKRNRNGGAPVTGAELREMVTKDVCNLNVIHISEGLSRIERSLDKLEKKVDDLPKT